MKKWINWNLLILLFAGVFHGAPTETGAQQSAARRFVPTRTSNGQQAVGGFRRSNGSIDRLYQTQALPRTQNVGGHLRQAYPQHNNVPQYNPIRRTAFRPQDGLTLQAPDQLSGQNDPNLLRQDRNQNGLHYQTESSIISKKLVKGASQAIRFDFDVKEAYVENNKIVSCRPIGTRGMLIRALEIGSASITFASADKSIQKTYDFSVEIDVRQLQEIINKNFPTANVIVSPIKSAVILRGTVPTPEMVTQILEVAKRFSPEVMQNLKIAGAQNIALQMKVYEVSRTKLREIGADWQIQGGTFSAIQSVSQLIQGAADAANSFTSNGGDLRAGIINGDTQFFANIQFLEQHDVAKLVDEPFMVTLNGRPSNFLSGGEIPIIVNGGLGVASVEFRPFGTKVDMLPFVLGDGQIRLDLQYEISQVAEGISGATDTPGFIVRRANGAVVMRAGHSLVIAGHQQTRRTNTKRGLPGLMHMNLLGNLFRNNKENDSETELLIIATPSFIGDVDPAHLPMRGPGQTTKKPTNAEYYIRGYHEVPNVPSNAPRRIVRCTEETLQFKTPNGKVLAPGQPLPSTNGGTRQYRGNGNPAVPANAYPSNPNIAPGYPQTGPGYPQSGPARSQQYPQNNAPRNNILPPNQPVSRTYSPQQQYRNQYGQPVRNSQPVSYTTQNRSNSIFKPLQILRR